MALGAIVKAGAKSLAKDKAKSFITGKGKGKGGALKKTGEQKPKVNPSNLMGRQVGGDTGGANIPASRQTINITPLGSDSSVKSGGGSGDIKIVQDISLAVSEIAESMKSGLILKDKAAAKERKAAEKEKRALQEADVEKPDDKKKEGGGMPNLKVPGVGMLSGIFGFITKFIYGIVIMKLIEFLPKLKGLLGVLKGAGKVFNFLINFGGKILDALAGAIDFGYKLVDGAEKVIGNIFGEEGAEKFRTFTKNFTTLINSFLIFKILKAKVFDAIVRNIKNAFKFAKNIIKNAGKVVAKLFPNLAKGAGKIFQAGKGLLSKGASKVGGFAAKIFGKAAGVISPAFKGAKPFLSKFFGKIPIVGPLVITIVSLLSGEPASQAIFKGLGAALGGALGTFIPIPILGTLIGETIGVFVGDLIYELLMGGGIKAVGQKLKDTFMTIFKGGKFVFDFMKNGFVNFINNFKEEHMIKLPKILGVQVKLPGIGDTIPNLLQLYNPLAMAPLLVKSFFGGEKKGDDIKKDSSTTVANTISATQETFGGEGGSTYETKAGKDAKAVASETTYESGEGDAMIIPVPMPETKTVSTGRRNRRGSGAKTRVVVVDDTELAMYGGK